MRPYTSYLIVATPRSGSYLLCEALVNIHLAGYPTEYFGPMQTGPLLKRWGISNYAACLSRIMEEGTTSNGVFGAKIIWEFSEYFVDHLRSISGYEKLPMSQLMSRVFPDLRYIWITRRDKVKQAISYWKAIQTNAWIGIQSLQPSAQTIARWKEPWTDAGIGSQNPQRSKREVTFDFKAIERLRRGLEQDEVEIQQYFTACGVQPFKVVYEDFVHTYEQTALQILDYLHVQVPDKLVFGERQMSKQANEQSEEWIQRYYQLKQEENTNKIREIGD